MLTLDNERFFVEYSDGAGRWEPFTMYWNINDKNITKFWKQSLLSNYLKPDNITSYGLLDKRYMNKGFPMSRHQKWTRDVSHICNELHNAIDIINTQLNPLGYPVIEKKFSPERVWNDEYFRDDFNELHHHFEVLIGQVWSQSKWYKKHATCETRWAIHCLNNACHEIEVLKNTISELEKNPSTKRCGWTGISFNTFNWDGVRRKEKEIFEYDKEHFNDWETKWWKWGALLPYYSQLGKTLREVYEDGDDYIDESNISSHCLMTGEVQIALTGPGAEESMLTHDNELKFKKWLEERGYDYNDPKVGAGTAIMGTPALELFREPCNPLLWMSLDNKIKRCDNITAIGFVDEELNIIQDKSRRYDYTWQEQYELEQKMFEHNSDTKLSHILTETAKPW